MTADWTIETVASCLQPLALPRTKLQTKAYRRSGLYPIIDQGQLDIAGWTDDGDGVIDVQLPVIVFGDHSRTLKYVDFPFVRGADGTQILKPRADIEPRFFYYALRSLNLESRGYNRHFTLLKEQAVSIPEWTEQVQIAALLKTVEDGIRLQEREISAVEDLKAAAMEHVFRRGVGGEDQVDSEIGPVPQSWVVEDLGDSHDVRTGATPSRSDPRYWVGGTIPWVKTAQVSYSTIADTSEHITESALQETNVKLFPAGTLLLAMYGQGVTRGKVAKLGIEATCNQACAAIQCPNGEVDPDYLYHFLEWRYEDIRTRAHGGQQQNLSLDIVRMIPIAYPHDVEEQQEVAGFFTVVDQKLEVHRITLERFRELFDRMLYDFMTGNITSDDLPILASCPPDGAAV